MHNKTQYNLRFGFTLIELLVAIAIIAILAAILFRVFGAARERARQSACASNMKQIGLGMMQYMQDYDERTLATENAGGNSKGWAGRMYPYIKNTQVFTCPSDARTTVGLGNTIVDGVSEKNYLVSYAYNQAVRGALVAPNAKDGISLAAFTATAQTVAIFELNANAAPVTAIGEISSQGHTGASGGSYDAVMGGMDNAVGIIANNIRHKAGEGSNFLFYDGHVKYLKAVNVSCGATPNLSTAAQHAGPTTCQAADGSFPTTCAEGAGYSGTNKHQATMSYR